MDMHTDTGMLIAMTPGEFVGSPSESGSMLRESGLFITLPHGVVVQAEMPVDSVVFMVGEGGSRWLDGYSFRAAPHALRVPWTFDEDSK